MMLHRQHRHTRRRYLSIINILVTIPAVLFFSPVHAIPAITAAAHIPHAISTPTQIPPPTPATTSTYTVTKISSTTLTTSSPVLHISPHILSLITTMTVTTYEPWPAFPSENLDSPWSLWSTTVLEEVVSSVTWVERRWYLNVVDVGGTGDGHGGEEEEEEVRGRGDGKYEEEEERGKEEETTVTSFVVTTENTWVVHHPAGPAGIFLATGAGVVGCGGCSLAQATGSRPGGARAEGRERGAGEQMTVQRAVEKRKPKSQSRADTIWTEAEVAVVEDLICESTNLTTGCQGQCIWKPAVYNLQAIDTNDTSPSSFLSSNTSSTATATAKGTYWCLHIHPYHYADPSLRMGRACWGPYLRYRQLNAPCLVGDVGMACLPCVKGGEGEPGKKDESWDAVFWEGEE